MTFEMRYTILFLKLVKKKCISIDRELNLILKAEQND
jgi:hypothetical protein